MRHGAILGMVRRGGLLLVLLAVLAGAGVPRGWMPRASAAGVAVSLCSAGLHGQAREQALAAANALLAQALDHGGAGDDEGGETCPFAALPSAALLPALPLLLAEVSPAGARPVLLPQPAVIDHGLAAPPPPATGPPLHR